MKTPEEMTYEYGKKFDSVEISKNDIYMAWYDGYKVAQEHAHAALEEAEAEMAKMKDQLAGVSKVMPQWISVKDRLPDIYQRVLILIRGRIFISSIEEEYGDEYRDGAIRFWDGDWDWPEVTHWMPLPAPPKEEK